MDRRPAADEQKKRCDIIQQNHSSSILRQLFIELSSCVLVSTRKALQVSGIPASSCENPEFENGVIRLP